MAKICGLQVGVGKIGEVEPAVAKISRIEVGTHQARPLQIDALKKCARYVDADEGNAVLIEFLERFATPAAAAFSLRSVYDLPCLIMLLLDPVAGFGKVEDHRDEDAEDLEVVEHFEKRPMIEPVGDPFAAPFNGPEGQSPGVLDPLFLDGPGLGSLAVNSYYSQEQPPPAEKLASCATAVKLIRQRLDAHGPASHRRSAPRAARHRSPGAAIPV